MPTQGYLGAFYGKVFTMDVEDCEDVWEEGAPVTGVTSEIDAADKKEGAASVRLTMGTDAEIGVLASEVVALDLTKHRRITLWIKSSIITASGDLQLLLDEHALCVSPLETLNLPALAADTWTAVTLTLVDPSALGSIISVGLKQTVDLGICIIRLDAIKAISSLVVSGEAVGTGDGNETEFDLDYPNIDLDTLVVYVDAVATRDFEVTPKGHITFVTAPANLLDITADYTYWVVENKGGFYNWAYAHTGDVADRTDFSTTGWKQFVALLKGWTGTAEGFWLNEKWMAEVGNLLVVKFYDDEGNTKRYEGFAQISGISVSASVSTLITQPISFQGHGVLARETT